MHKLLDLGGETAGSAQYDSAYFYFSQAETLSREIDYPPGILSSILGLGLVYQYQQEYQQALDHYLQAETIHREIGSHHADLGALYYKLGSVRVELGDHLQARANLLKALELQTATDDSQPSVADSHYQLGRVYQYFEEYQSAQNNFMAALPIYLKHYGENGSKLAELYTGLGNAHDVLGNVDQAEQYYQKAVAIYMENQGDHWNIAYPYSSLGSLYLKTNRRQQGLNYFLRSLDLCHKNRQQLAQLEAINQHALAKYYLQAREYQTSREHAQMAVDIIQQSFNQEHPSIGECYSIIGQTYIKEGDYHTADEWFEEARKLVKKGYGENHPRLAELYLEQSTGYLDTQKHVKAIVAAQESLLAISETFNTLDPKTNPTADEVMDANLLVRIIKLKGDIFKGHASQTNRQENLVSALTQYQQAAITLDHLRRGYLSESTKLFLQNHAHPIYQRGIEVSHQLFSLNQSEEYLPKTFFFIEKSKASLLSEALQKSIDNRVAGVSPQLLQQEMDLAWQHKSLKLKLAGARIDQSDSTNREVKQALFHCKTQIDSLEKVIHSSYPNYHQLKYNMDILEFEEAQSQVPDEAVALSFFEATDSWYLLALGESCSLAKIRKSDLSTSHIERFRQNLANPESNLDSLISQGYHIYRELLAETLEQHHGSRQLIVLPDGILHYLPLEALVSTETRINKPISLPQYLVQNFSISYRTSMTLFANQPKTGGYDHIYMGFAPSYSTQGQLIAGDSLTPLKRAQSEVERAGDMFNGEKYLDQQATEFAFKNRDVSASILHLALHTLVDDQDPLNSRLLFSQDSLEDGNLTVHEIYQLKLDAELAVLSAGHTHSGRIGKGEGITSLSRVLMFAGCPNILMSLWQAKDQPSSIIMNTFFENLKKGLPKDESLQDAKIKYLSTADLAKAHPANWATLVLFGDYYPLSRPNNPWLWVGLGALFLVLGGLYYQQRQKRKRMMERALRE